MRKINDLNLYLTYLNKFKTKKKGIKYGLKYIPTLEPYFSDDEDFFMEYNKPFVSIDTGNGQFSESDGNIIKKLLRDFKDEKILIVEIGRANNRFYGGSSTQIFIDNKNKKSVYLGIDINPNAQPSNDNIENNVYVLNCDTSTEEGKELILNKIKELGFNKIDWFHVDGGHSINQKINDWGFVKYVKKNGIITLHDVNYHQGGKLVFDAISRKLFYKKKYFEKSINDWGLGVVKKL